MAHVFADNKTHRPTFADNYAGVSGDREGNTTYDLESVLSSLTNRAISAKSSSHSSDLFLRIREQAKIDLQCSSRISNTAPSLATKCYGDCLYDLENDPCEFSDIAKNHPNVVIKLKKRLTFYESITVPQVRAAADLRSNPANWDGYWSSWLDEETDSKSSIFIHGILTVGVTFIVWKKIINLFIVA